jgi:hypothetical protein
MQSVGLLRFAHHGGDQYRKGHHKERSHRVHVYLLPHERHETLHIHTILLVFVSELFKDMKITSLIHVRIAMFFNTRNTPSMFQTTSLYPAVRFRESGMLIV